MGETLLVLAALVIFSLAAMQINDTKFDNNNDLMESELELSAIGIAQSFIQEASSLSFDEAVTDTTYTTGLPGLFTDPVSLGPDGGETYGSFDDVDDFNGYASIVNTPRIDYNVSITVSYADSSTISPGYANRSFLKIMTVIIASEYFTDSLKVEYNHSYY
ncbi:hypothetical protein ACFL6O_02750 [candidate division KSB1 bacterium]